MGTTAAMEKKFDAVESMLAWLHSECQFSHDALASKKHGLVCLASQQPVNWHENITVGSGPVYGGPVFFGSHMAVARWIWKRLHSDSNLEGGKIFIDSGAALSACAPQSCAGTNTRPSFSPRTKTVTSNLPLPDALEHVSQSGGDTPTDQEQALGAQIRLQYVGAIERANQEVANPSRSLLEERLQKVNSRTRDTRAKLRALQTRFGPEHTDTRTKLISQARRGRRRSRLASLKSATTRSRTNTSVLAVTELPDTER